MSSIPISRKGIGFFFFSSRRRHTRLQGDWSSDVCSSDLARTVGRLAVLGLPFTPAAAATVWGLLGGSGPVEGIRLGELETFDPAGWQVAKPPILFPKPNAAPA